MALEYDKLFEETDLRAFETLLASANGEDLPALVAVLAGLEAEDPRLFSLIHTVERFGAGTRLDAMRQSVAQRPDAPGLVLLVLRWLNAPEDTAMLTEITEAGPPLREAYHRLITALWEQHPRYGENLGGQRLQAAGH